MFLMRVVILSTLLVLLTMASAATAGPFDPFMGRWTGAGQFKRSGNSEGGKCVSTFISTGERTIKVMVRCATGSGVKVEVKCNFSVQGSRLSGPCQVVSHSNEVYQVSGGVSGNSINGQAQTSSGRVRVSITKLGRSSLSVSAASESWSLASTMVR